LFHSARQNLAVFKKSKLHDSGEKRKSLFEVSKVGSSNALQAASMEQSKSSMLIPIGLPQAGSRNDP